MKRKGEILMSKNVLKRLLCLILTILLTSSSAVETAFAANLSQKNDQNRAQEIVVTEAGDLSLDVETVSEKEVLEMKGEKEVTEWDDLFEIPNYGYHEIEKEETLESIYALPTDEVGSMEEVEKLPEKYVNENLPDTRSQGLYGTCWAHASIAVAEANLMKQKVLGEGQVDTSELHLAYFAFHTTDDPLGGISEDTRSTGMKGENYLEAGGNAQQATRTLFAWMGTAAEETAPYTDCPTAYTEGLDHGIAFQDIAHIKNAYVVDTITEREEVKRLVYEYGAATTSYFAAQRGGMYPIGGKNYYFTDFYSYDYNAYYCPVEVGTNHAVTIVGWDDNFPKENFPTQPQGDGAWLIRNSWTTTNSTNYNGYFWMSYYDKSLKNESYAYEMERADNYDNNYQYDGTFFSVPSGADISANVFEVKANELGESLEAIAFETDNTNVDYTVEIYTKVDEGGDPSTGKLVEICKGRTKYAGYHTIVLDYPIALNYNERFAVVVKLNKEGYNVSVKQELSYNDSNFSSIAQIKNGESFYYSGSHWYDVANIEYYSAGNFCIKAYTKNFEERVEPTGILFPEIPEDGLTLGAEEEYQVNVTVLPVNALETIMSYKTSDENIATVTEDGKIKGIRKGTANITVTTSNNVSKSFKVQVIEKVNSIAIQGKNSLYAGNSYDYTVSWEPLFVTPTGSVQWSSDNPEIISIDENTGRALAVTNGSTTIRAKLDGATAALKVHVWVDPQKAEFQITIDLDNIVTFSWKPVPGAKKYAIYRAGTKIASFAEDGRESYSFVDTFYQGVTEKQTVTYQFEVIDSQGWSKIDYYEEVGPGYRIIYDIPHGTNHFSNPAYYRK